MNNVTVADQGQLIEQILIKGDLSGLTPAQRAEYAVKVCDSIGLNPLTKPFDYIQLSGKLVLYAKRDATDQLRKIHNVSIKIVSREMRSDLCVVTANASLPNGRHDESIGAVSVQGLKGDTLANAIMKAETKSKRRVTLSICGLGLLDETEIETVSQEPPKQPSPKEIAPPANAQSTERLKIVSQIFSSAKALEIDVMDIPKWLKSFCGKETSKDMTMAELSGFRSKLSQANEIMGLAKRLNVPKSELETWTTEFCGCNSFKDMSVDAMSAFLDHLQTEIGRQGVDLDPPPIEAYQ